MLRQILFALLVGVVSLSTGIVSAEEPPATGGSRIDPEKLAAAMEMMAKPSESHKHLQEMVGEYKTIAHWSDRSDPTSTKTMRDEGTATFESILGGRFVVQEFHGHVGGEKFEGMGLYGYDNAQQKFVGVWVDSMGTGILHTSGKRDPKTGKVIEDGHIVTPVGKMLFRFITEPTEEGFVFNMYEIKGSEESLMGKIEYIKQ